MSTIISIVLRTQHFVPINFNDTHLYNTGLQEIAMLADQMKLECDPEVPASQLHFDVGELCCAKFPGTII